MKHFLVFALMLFGIWLLLNGSLSPQIMAVGALLSVFIALTAARSNDLFKPLRLNPKALIHAVLFLFVFIVEVIKSNIDVALRVVSPSLPIHPGIVEVNTSLTSPLARLILTSAITLTPGTLTVDSRDGRLFIHWIDVRSADIEAASQAIVRKFERHLEVMYG